MNSIFLTAWRSCGVGMVRASAKGGANVHQTPDQTAIEHFGQDHWAGATDLVRRLPLRKSEQLEVERELSIEQAVQALTIVFEQFDLLEPPVIRQVAYGELAQLSRH